MRKRAEGLGDFRSGPTLIFRRRRPLVHRPVLILGLAVLALATVVSRKPWLTPKRLIYRTHVLRLDDALVRIIHNPTRKRGILGKSLAYASGYEKLSAATR
ncbi:hypothetical protein Pla52n_16080 [Stieleria varia]|uniref:Uncharacterized protein n=1 Tax=Stieleria varia TaxID=2528005 RepID=A0A5C6B152_9BACT|nr:hypothetical protein Pla52n_16080 [Stieleria varia]